MPVCIRLLLVLGISGALRAELPPLIDRDAFFGEVKITAAEISPDGKYISFMKPYNGTRNIWVKKTSEPFTAAKPMSAEAKRPVPAPAARQSPASCRVRPFRSPRDSISCRRPAPRRFRHSLENLAVAGTSAEIPGEAFPNLLECGIVLSVQQVDRCENHPRRADAALRPAAF